MTSSKGFFAPKGTALENIIISLFLKGTVPRVIEPLLFIGVFRKFHKVSQREYKIPRILYCIAKFNQTFAYEAQNCAKILFKRIIGVIVKFSTDDGHLSFLTLVGNRAVQLIEP
jgi:hypothetical protein